MCAHTIAASVDSSPCICVTGSLCWIAPEFADLHGIDLVAMFSGTLSTIMAAYPAMMEEKQGTIVIVSSAICFAGTAAWGHLA